MIKGFLKWLAGVLAGFIILFLIFFIFIQIITDTEPVVVDNSYLSVKLSGNISEYTAPDPFEEALGKSELDIKKIRDVLEKAQVDDRINGVVLKIGFLQTGYAKIEELRNLVKNFRKSSKPIYAFLGPEIAFMRDYYLASACDSIFIPPSANLFLNGIGGEITFYKDFLKKIGVEAQFSQIGKYKNAPDVYTRNRMSDPHRQVLGEFIGNLHRDVLMAIATDRDIPESKITSFVNDISGFTGQQAHELGLVDVNGFNTDFGEKLTKNQKNSTRLTALDYAQVPASSLKIRNKSRIAVINCVGVISSGNDSEDPYFGKIMGSETVIQNLKKAANSSSIKAIILRIDSPGGSASASDAIWSAIQEAKQKKPVIASVSNYGASGGYYISMAADTMIATPNSLVGSIGIFAGKFNIRGLYEKLDLKSETIKSAKNAGLFSVIQPWSAAEQKIIKRLISAFYKDFVQKTADSRGMSFDQVDQIAQGRVWSGNMAVKNGLFDNTGYFYSAVNAAMEMAQIDSSESARLVYYPREKSMFSELLGNLIKATNSENPIDQLRNYLALIQNKPLSLMPFQITWN